MRIRTINHRLGHGRGYESLLLVLLLAVSLACAPAGGGGDAVSPGDAIATTTAGQLQGAFEDGLYVFRGVPYGASTAGAGRFKPPKPRAAWGGVRDAIVFGPICPQEGSVATGQGSDATVGFIEKLPQSEDCLVLNLWTPGLDDGRRPVMVWLHGRGYSQGAGSEGWYDGTELAESGDVVVVTINHRLNVFGYLHLAELGGEDFAGSGVAGMLDAVLSLEWVRDNIAEFGGDPSRVLLFGESGGGAKVSTMLALPSGEGLFHRAVIQSGPSLRATEPEGATAIAERLLVRLGLRADELSELQQVPFEKVTEAIGRVSDDEEGGPLGFRPVLDSQYFPNHPFDPVAAPSSVGVAVMIGSNRDESALFSTGDAARGTMDEDELMTRAERILGDRKDAVVEVYREQRPEATPWDLYTAISSERTRLASIQLAESQAAASDQPVYMYLFDWETDFGDGLYKACHALEIPFVFNHPDLVPLTGSLPGQEELAEEMSQAWIAFARSGDPNHPGLPQWDPYDAERRATMVFDTESQAVDDPRREERLAWEGIGPRRF